jgi:hypothetical protein
MSKKEIFTITTLRKIMTDPNRCVGYYFDLDKAFQAVRENLGDIHEMGYYPYCVIESIKEGIYATERTEYWFEWNIDKDCYELLDEKPDKFHRIVCFGIG